MLLLNVVCLFFSVPKLINLNELYCDIYMFGGARGGAVGLGTALQAGRSRGSIPDDIIGIFD